MLTARAFQGVVRRGPDHRLPPRRSGVPPRRRAGGVLDDGDFPAGIVRGRSKVQAPHPLRQGDDLPCIMYRSIALHM